jgi:ankyrin repeat protein
MVQNKFNTFFFQLYLCALLFIICPIANSEIKHNLPSMLQQQLLSGHYQKALPQLKQLAKKENSLAQYQLALLYLQGNAVDKSSKQAQYWLLQAAANNSKASYLLGSLYARGKTFKKDLTKAKYFLGISKELGNFKAKKLYKKLFSATSLVLSSQELQTALIVAIKQGKLDDIVQLYRQGAKLTLTHKQGDTPLALALKNKQEDIALWIIKTIRLQNRDVNFNQRDSDGNSALHLAVKNNYLQVVRLLIDNKVSIDMINVKKQTPLILAVMNKNKAIAQQLINQGALLNKQDMKGNTAIDYANKFKLPLVISLSKTQKKQLQANSLQVSSSLSPKMLAKKRQALQLQSTDKKSPYYSWPILNIAVAQKQSVLIRKLLKEKYDPWQVNIQNESAIIIAVKQDQTKLALQLLAASQKTIATLTSENIKQLYIIFRVAIKHNNLVFTKELLKLTDSRQLAKVPIKQTPLWYAIELKRTAAFIMIAQNLAITHRQNKQLQAYLLRASQLNLLPISTFLISLKFDVNLVDEKGRSALWYAADFANESLVDELISAKSNVKQLDTSGYSPLIRAVLSDCISCVTSLLSAGANAQKPTMNANSALMFAAQGKPTILAVILNFYHQVKNGDKLNIKQRNNNSLTPLMLAVKSQCAQCVKLLLKSGSNPKRKNAQGENSFDLAKDNANILSILKSY